jgi:hypothetical protein
MPHSKQFAINPERVVHETIDGETIIIELESGTYYSLAGPGAEIWAMLATGHSTEEIVGELERSYDASPEQLEAAMAELVRELRQEQLLKDGADVPPGERPSNGTGVEGTNGARVPFQPPTLQKYTDMQYFLQLDPIHEVDGIGWPNPPEHSVG